MAGRSGTVTLFPWLILLLLMALVAELLIVGPRALRSVLRGEGFHVQPASARAVLVLVLLQIGLVIGWLVLVGARS